MALENTISKYVGSLVGSITDTYTGLITISPAPYKQQADGTSVFMTEVSPIISAGVVQNDTNKVGAEKFRLNSGVLNDDGSATYSQIARGIPNAATDESPLGHLNFQYSHSEPSVVIIDATYEMRAMDASFTANVANRFMQAFCFDAVTNVSVGDGRYYIQVPAKYNNGILSIANASVITAGTTGNTTIQIHNVTQGVDMLSTPITIASGATTGSGIIDTANDDIATGDILRIDIDSVSTTAPKGLIVNLEFLN